MTPVSGTLEHIWLQINPLVIGHVPKRRRLRLWEARSCPGCRPWPPLRPEYWHQMQTVIFFWDEVQQSRLSLQ